MNNSDKILHARVRSLICENKEVFPIGPTGPTGPSTPGPTGPTGPGALQQSYADFYAMMPDDNASTVAIGGSVAFPNTSVNVGGSIVYDFESTSTFKLIAAGTYLVQFQVSVSESGQLCIKLNGVEQTNTVVGRSALFSQIVGMSIIQATANSTLSIVNVSGNSFPLTLTPAAGGGRAVSAHLIIMQLS